MAAEKGAKGITKLVATTTSSLALDALATLRDGGEKLSVLRVRRKFVHRMGGNCKWR